MNLHKPTACIFVPDNAPEPQALERITHLGIGAHQDDLEIMAFHGIAACFDSDTLWFGGVACTGGGGSARTGEYSSFSDEQMREARRREQNQAARIGRYGAMIQLDYSSAEAKSPEQGELPEDLEMVIRATRPEVIYTHNPADKHDTHVAVVCAALEAIRRLPVEVRPRAVYGCEVWRGLDWLCDDARIALDVGGHDELAKSLLAAHKSQIAGGKRYDLATLGKRQANATYYESHETDRFEQLWFAMDLTPLVRDDRMSLVDFVGEHCERFAADVRSRLIRHTRE